jgi:hypothetical protein
MNSASTLNCETKFAARRGEPGGRSRMTGQVMPGPDVGRTRPSGLAGLAFEAEVYRLRPEGLSLRPFTEE